jgi:hypothetical protein
VSKLVDELVAEAKAARRAKAAYERHLERVRELLPQVRAEDPKKYGPATLEGMIFEVYERGTISRLTADAAGTSKSARGTIPAEPH